MTVKAQVSGKTLGNLEFNIKEMIKIVPENYIVFQCEDNQPMGEVRISFMPLKNYPIDNLEPCFELMCTNKENYKVSHAKGKLEISSSNLIRIYIKNIDNLEKCLRDKFRIRIYRQKQPDQTIYQIKLKVLIEKKKQSIKIDDMTNNLTQTASRTASLYTNPSIYMNLSPNSTAATDIKSVLYYSRLMASQKKSMSVLQIKHQTLSDVKGLFDESTIRLCTKQKQIKNAENNLQKNKAKQKLCLGLLISVFLVSLVLGFIIKNLLRTQIWQDTSQYVASAYYG